MTSEREMKRRIRQAYNSGKRPHTKMCAGIFIIAVVVVAFIPNATSYFSSFLGIGRGIDFVVYLSILLLFYLIFRIYVRLEALNSSITKLTRAIAIQRGQKKK